MRAIGLTGNIGCGKSAVASLLSKYPDVEVLDCDLIAKEILSCGNHKKEICNILVQDVFPGGRADFALIGEIIFKNLEKKKLLEKLIHPLVWAAVEVKANTLGNHKMLIVESALIYETRSADKFSAVIVATCDPIEQVRRLQTLRGMSIAEIQDRIAQQVHSPEKEMSTTFVIATNCSWAQLRSRVHNLYLSLKKQTY